MITPSWYPTRRQLREFAAISLVGFGLIGALVWHSTGATRLPTVLWAIGAALFVIGMPFPTAIRPVYVLLIGLTLPIGWIVTQVLMRMIFYIAFTPLGLIFRLIGRDPLRIKKPQTDSYWLDHVQRSDLASYYRQS